MTPDILPNDGPVIRWALQHARELVIGLNERFDFDDRLARFRERRDQNQDIEQLNNIEFKLDDLHGTINMFSGPHQYMFTVVISGVWISDILDRPGHGDYASPKGLTVSVKDHIPASILDQMIGQEIDQVIILPKEMHSIIAGRTILKIMDSFNVTVFDLQVDQH